ncbi:Hypothetical protein I595_1646 [Croceitalea dokdonensis DOKDO 023]|uniref:Chemotaxis methyl-accepting receptor HlyB-like 4HB MCP domain-containing protein n=2 Tax=Croceitalea TaxID=574891 RepID=A0A0P7AU59_9FLAO|nr:Hypothetical protein I595_1646 [Croceitalea dokdonensis DOKDO 023]
MAFLLVLGSNRLDQKHFSTVQNTVNSVYKDRVVVQDIIYRINNLFHKKELRFIRNGNFTDMVKENKEIDELLLNFGGTKLTQNESRLLTTLNQQFSKIQELEGKVANPTADFEADLGIVGIKTLKEMQKNLDALAAIQLSESEQLTELSNKSLGMNIMLSKLEVGFLILFGAAMIFMIFYPKPKVELAPEN